MGALRCHHTRDHVPEDLAQRYAPDGLCRACGSDFSTRPRVLHHLRYRGTSCLARLVAMGPPLGEEVVLVCEPGMLKTSQL